MAWLHHKGRNKHHFEYWIDYTLDENGKVGFGGNRMPKRYVAEMFCDRVAASKIYQKENYRDDSALKYFLKGKATRVIHPETSDLLEHLLVTLAEQGEEAAFAETRALLKQEKEAAKQ
jgi:pyrroloquinoline quinone (PQQ) biosynthesis protein C